MFWRYLAVPFHEDTPQGQRLAGLLDEDESMDVDDEIQHVEISDSCCIQACAGLLLLTARCCRGVQYYLGWAWVGLVDKIARQYKYIRYRYDYLLRD